ncbi:PQQ-binding-like beta-propeller repeat protein [Paenibacillus sp. HJL G12]|uniref:PQQ-binding-like beta-propeller repeat protein n=1 Tax=Paenibacillus dendrobii TaxID=2691084 RepID=A0A7X3IN39_9BACL|nr:PQQ-binding-like beta-propeller repeat protein [Paenibacillus dendrobii]MWV47013.1 PQQ-binding-like beta-propeller repeat protein [Paenibacillus dendrobii]
MKPLKSKTSAAVLMLVSCMLLILILPAATGTALSSQPSASKPVQAASKFVFHYRTPYFPTRLTASSAWADFKAADYGSIGETVKAKPVNGDLGLVASDSEDGRWIPLWYTTAAAKAIAETEPAYVTLNPNAKLSLAPGSALKWAPPQPGGKLVALAKWKDWTGVLISPQTWMSGGTVYRPVLFWVSSASISSMTMIPAGVLSKDSDVPTELARNMTEIWLQKGEDQARVQKLLGTPDATEHSANLAELGDPMRMGTTWRYERQLAQFTVSFSKEGKLEAWKWILPADRMLQMNVYSGDNYTLTYDFRSMPAGLTLNAKPVWRNQGDLNYSYLIGATNEVLLLNGDDGGFSGMHHDSSIYAVDRASGRKLWQIDAGFGMLDAFLDESSDTAAIYTEYDAKKNIYEHHVRELNLKDGKLLWEKLLPEGHQLQMYAAKDVILLHQVADSAQASGVLTVLDRATGKQLWNQSLRGNQQILRTDSEDPYILIQEGLTLKALDPKDGTKVWSVSGRGDLNQDPQTHPYYSYGTIHLPLEPWQSSRWFLIGNAWMLLDTESGRVLAQYPWSEQERFETTNEQRYILVQRSGGSEYFDASNIKETSLYDVFEQRVIWTLHGKAVSGAFDSTRLYVVLNGLPAAVDRSTGNVLWQMPVTTTQSSSPYTLDEMAKSRYAVLSKTVVIGYGSDMLVLRKEDGGLLGRIRDNLLDFSEAHYRRGIEGLLNMSGGELYVGSSNGGLARYQQTELDRLLEMMK